MPAFYPHELGGAALAPGGFVEERGGPEINVVRVTAAAPDHRDNALSITKHGASDFAIRPSRV